MAKASPKPNEPIPQPVDVAAETLRCLQAIERHLAVLASTVQPMDRHSLPLVRTRS